MAQHEPMTGGTKANSNTVLDPVCGMYVDPQKARGSAEYAGKKYFFCSQSCVERFKTDPENYLARDTRAKQLVALGGIAKVQAPSATPATPPDIGQGNIPED